MPPLAGVAVNVIGVPLQTGFADALMVTETGWEGLTVIVMVLLMAGLFKGQFSFDET